MGSRFWWLITYLNSLPKYSVMIKAVVFDLWDTLILVKGVHPIIQIREFLELSNLDLYDFSLSFERAIMLKPFSSMKDAFKEVLLEFNVEPTPENVLQLSDIWTKTMGQLEFPKEIQKALLDLRSKYKLGLLTNTDIFSISFVRSKFNIENYFDQVIMSYDVGVVKPDKEFFQLLLNKLGVEPGECLMVGDNLYNDIVPAKELGMKTLLVDFKNRWEGKKGIETTDIRVASMEDFLNILLNQNL